MAFLRGFTVRFLLPLSMLVVPLTSLSAQRIESMEFHDKPIADILLGLAELSGKSIIPDETVTGRASYYFSKTDFDTALRVFLSTYNLYLTVEDGFYHVSRVKTVFDPLSQTLAVDGEDVEIASVLNSVSRSLGKTILYDPLPSEPITLHAKMIAPDNLLDLIVRKLRGFEIEAARDYYYIKKIAPNFGQPGDHKPDKKNTF